MATTFDLESVYDYDDYMNVETKEDREQQKREQRFFDNPFNQIGGMFHEQNATENDR